MTRPLTLFAISTLALGGCSGAVGLFSDMGAAPDAGVMPGGDAAVPMSDGAGLGESREADGVLGPAASGDLGDVAALAECYDGLDNPPENGRVDCQDDGCGGLASCCAGPDFDCCDAPAAVVLPTLCTGSLDLCGAGAGYTLFGLPTPTSDGTSIFPNGDHAEDSGLVVDAPLDPTLATFVEGDLSIPAVACATPPCVESAGIALAPQTAYGAHATVRPVIGVVASAGLGRVLLVAGDVVLQSFPAPPSPMHVSLKLSATGLVEAMVGGIGPIAAQVPRATSSMRLVVYGHSENRDSTSVAMSAHATITMVGQGACDVPSVWRTRSALMVGTGGGALPSDVRGPSVAYAGTDAYLAFASQGNVYVAHRSIGAATPDDYAMQDDLGHPQLTATGAVLADPDIHAVTIDGGIDGLRIYVANESTGAILYAEADLAAPSTFGAMHGVLGIGDALLTNLDATNIDGPSVLPPGADRTDWIMAARVTFTAGPARIVLFRSADGLTNWDLAFAARGAGTSPLDASTVAVPTTLDDVSHDDVASPSLMFRDGGYQLFYAGRTLGRWAVGAMMSDNLALWRRSPSPVALAGTGTPGGFDAYGALDPAISTVDGDPTRVEMLYVGTNGAGYALGRVSRSATNSWALRH